MCVQSESNVSVYQRRVGVGVEGALLGSSVRC